jgi:1,5-anhydro-D-fructose reductase (1,5-anhydro-D-mannitol-forming)
MKIAMMSLAHVHAAGIAEGLRALGVELLVSDPYRGDRPAGETGGRSMAGELGVGYVDSYDELFHWQPDGVVVCSENTRHRQDVERAAAAHAHVLCEKPLATNRSDAQAMITACEQAGVRLMTAYPVRYSPAFTAVRAAHRAGALGRIRSIQGTNNGRIPQDRAWFTDPRWSGGGSLIDHVVHLADLVDVLLDGTPAVSVMAMANSGFPGAPAVETGALVSVGYADGTIVSMDSSWLIPAGYPTWGGLTLEVIGDAGNAAMDAFNQRLDGFRASTGRTVRLNYGIDPNQLMLQDFLRTVETGEQPWIDPASSLRSMSVAAAALESARSGRVVTLQF